MDNILKLPLADICSLLQSGSVSSAELTEAYLENIQKNAHLNAYISVTAERAMESARASDVRRAQGQTLSALDGVPLAVKDKICVEGARATCASRMLNNFYPPYTATAVNRLLSKGGVILGKTNMDEFAMGSSSDTSYFGTVLNPLDTSRSPGGSSGGSAAAVAAGLAPYALGTDTGGSVRQPAAYCGLVGIKPTYGAISRYGMMAFASSLDQMGIISHDIKSNAIVLDAIKGKDPLDATSLDIRGSFLPDSDIVRGLRVGVCIPTGTSDAMTVATHKAAEALRERGAKIYDVPFFSLDVLICTYVVLSFAEASSNLARYDGVRYGHRATDVDSLDELFKISRSEGFGEEVKRRILVGAYCLSTEGKEKYYKKALAARQLMTDKMAENFDKYDILISPTSADLPPLTSEKCANAVEGWGANAYTATSNLVGTPSLAVPVKVDGYSLPCSVQLTGPALSEKLLYTAGLVIEEAQK